MSTQTKNLVEITQDAIQILYKELGVVNAVRFLNQFTTGFGDYTLERDRLFTDQSLDDLLSEIKQSRMTTAQSESQQRLRKIQQRYPHAYERWTPADDDELRRLFREGVSVQSLAGQFGRQPSAIQSRLRKLGLA